MAWQSIAQWQARHSPQYVTAVQKLQMQRQIAHEVEDRRHAQQIEALQYQAAREREREQAREATMLAVEESRGKNQLALVQAELDAKIRLMGVEGQVAAFTRILDEQTKNREHFRELLTKRADFRAEMQKSILQALIAKKAGGEAHAQTIEKMRLDSELKTQKAEIDELTNRAIAYGEFVAKKDGEAAAAKALDDLVKKWEFCTG